MHQESPKAQEIPVGNLPGGQGSQSVDSTAPGGEKPGDLTGSKRRSNSPAVKKPAKKTKPNFLLPVLSQAAYSLWAHKYPEAAVAYMQVKNNDDVTQKDMDQWVRCYSKALALYNNLIELNLSDDSQSDMDAADTVSLSVDTDKDDFREEERVVQHPPN